MEQKFKNGLEVHTKVNPTETLVIRRFVDRIYYCYLKNDPKAKELALYEREIEPVAMTNTYDNY